MLQRKVKSELNFYHRKKLKKKKCSWLNTKIKEKEMEIEWIESKIERKKNHIQTQGTRSGIEMMIIEMK